MSTAKPPAESVLARAAELRAAGSSWESVAAKLNRAADAVRKWPTLYPAQWQAALHTAERRLVCETSAEAVLILRNLLRSDDEKVRRDAARFLIDLRLELFKLDRTSAADSPPQLTSDAARLVAFLEGHSDDELDRLVADMQHVPVPGRTHVLPQAVDRPD
jgi:hypothetical protein